MRFEPLPKKRRSEPLSYFEMRVLSAARNVLAVFIAVFIVLMVLLACCPAANGQDTEKPVATAAEEDLEIAGRLGDKLISRLSSRVKDSEEAIAAINRRNNEQQRLFERRFDGKLELFQKHTELQDQRREKLFKRFETKSKGWLDRMAENRQEMKRLKTDLVSARAELAAQRKWIVGIIAVTAIVFLVVFKFK